MADLSQVEAARKEGYSDADIAAHLAKMDHRIKEALDSGYEPKDIFARLSKPVSVEEPKTYSDRSTIVPIASMIAQAPGAVSDLGVMGTLKAMGSIPGDVARGMVESGKNAGKNFQLNELSMGTPYATMIGAADFLLGGSPSNFRNDVAEGNWRAAAGDVESMAAQAGMMAATAKPTAKGGPTLGAIARSPIRAADAALEAVGGAKKLGIEYARDIVNTGHGGLIATPVKMAARRILKKVGEGERDLSAFEKLAMQDTKRAQAAEFNLAKSISQAEDSVVKKAEQASISSGKAEANVMDKLSASQAKAASEAKAAWDDYFGSTGEMRNAAKKAAQQADERAFEAKQELLKEQAKQAASIEKNRGVSPREYRTTMDQIRAQAEDLKNRGLSPERMKLEMDALRAKAEDIMNRGVSPLENEITLAQIEAKAQLAKKNSKNLKGIIKNGGAAPEAPNTLLSLSREHARGLNPPEPRGAAEAPRSLPGPSGAIEKADPSLPLAERAEINLQRGKEATSSREARSQEIGAKTDASGWGDTLQMISEMKQIVKGKKFDRAAYDALPDKYKKTFTFSQARLFAEQAK